MTKEESIADEINNSLGLNLYENSRRLNLVDARSLYCYILHKELNYTLYQVRDTLRLKGKKFNHCSVYQSAKIFDEVITRRDDIRHLLNKIMNRSAIKSVLLDKINKIDSEEHLHQINDCINNSI
jgi:hypothetical protein